VLKIVGRGTEYKGCVMLKKTSRKNIKAILDDNNCGSLAEINQKESVSLSLWDLSGYLNLAEFTRGAVALRIYHSVPQDADWKNLWWETRDKKVLERAKTKKDLVELDASAAGDFGYWMFNDERKFHFIKSLKLRHPNQVFRFGIGEGFSVQNESLCKIIEQAKIRSRDNNMKNYRDNATLAQFHENLDSITRARGSISFENSEINKILSQIDELQKQIDVHKANKKEQNSQIQQQLQEISAKNSSSVGGRIEIPYIELLDDYWATIRYENNDSGDQAYSYKGLSKQELENLKARNRIFYSNQK